MMNKQTERMMGNNRIGEACWHKHEGKWKGGILRAWSMSYDVFEAGPGNWAAAVVEDNHTMRCVVVYAGDISFATIPPRD
jgi:hypothetical protein